MKTAKISTIIKTILFAALVIALLIFLFTGDSSKKKKTDSTVPSAPNVEDLVGEEQTDGAAEEGVGEAEVETVDPGLDTDGVVELDDDSPENRPLFIETTQSEIDSHSYLLENGQYEMYLKEENLSVIIREKETGAVMYSTVESPVKSNEEWSNFMKSSIILEYLVGKNIVTYRADMYTGEPSKDITYLDNGFTAKVSYPELEISYEVQVLLTENGLQVEIPQEKIEEKNDQFKVAGLYVYPFLGYSKLGDREGYMFIPDGSGALIHLDDNDQKYKQPYSKMVYGDNLGIDDAHVLSLFNKMDPFNEPEKVLAPVFGMVQTDSELGYLGIIEEGQFSAKIEAYPNGAVLPYNWITSKFIYRQVYNQPTSKDSGTMVVRQKNMNDFNIKVRYDFVTQQDASYVGLAGKYRNYLLDNELITKREDKFKVRVDLFGSDVEKGLIFKKDTPMTTFAQANDIFKDIQQKGATEIVSVYKGWQDKGYYAGLPIDRFKPESSLSDEYSLLDLIEESQKNDIDLYLYHDALRINTEENGNTKYKIMKKFNKRTYDEKVFGKVYNSLNFLHPQASVDILEKMKQNYEKNQIDQIMLSGISDHLFSYSEGNKEMDRIQTKTKYDSIISTYSQTFDLMLEQPFSYLWNYTNAIMDMPTQSSNYVFTDEDIPFLALTLKGIIPMYAEYTNFQANQAEFFLKLVEQGQNPSFYITHEDPSVLIYTNSSHLYSSMYERYEEMIQEYYEKLSAVHEFTKDSIILDYERQNDVTKVTYENGTIVYVNYQDESVTVDGHVIDGLSYKVVHDQ